jgi:hypothetical protein
LLTRLEGEPHAALALFLLSPPYAQRSTHSLRSSSGPQASSGSSAATKLDKLELLLNPTARNVPQDLI